MPLTSLTGLTLDLELITWSQNVALNVNKAFSRTALASNVSFASNKYTLTFNAPMYIDRGQVIYFKVPSSNTADSPEISINSTDYTLKRRNGSTVTNGLIPMGLMIHAIYDGTDFIIINSL